MVARLEELRHIDLSRVGIGFCQTRRQGRFGMHASLTPLRFPGGQAQRVRRGRTWRIQRVELDGREMLYLLNFYLPRFLDLPFAEKLTTVAHELWHIGPRFDGDLRRFGGRCYAHSGSQRRYDAYVGRLVDRWLACRAAGGPLRFPAAGLSRPGVRARPHLRPPHPRPKTGARRVRRCEKKMAAGVGARGHRVRAKRRQPFAATAVLFRHVVVGELPLIFVVPEVIAPTAVSDVGEHAAAVAGAIGAVGVADA